MNDIDKYAEWTDKTVKYPEFSWYPYLGLAEESGEVLGVLAKYERGDYDVLELNRRLPKELGDVFYMLCRICRDKGWNPSDILKANQEKLEERLKNNTIKGDGSDR